jgi:D-alanine transaminase
VIDGVLRTHPLNQHILPGITRRVVVELIREHGIDLAETAITDAELRRAEELFLCGSTTDVTPVISLDGTPVGAGTPGAVTQRLQALLESRLYATAGAAR